MHTGNVAAAEDIKTKTAMYRRIFVALLCRNSANRSRDLLDCPFIENARLLYIGPTSFCCRSQLRRFVNPGVLEHLYSPFYLPIWSRSHLSIGCPGHLVFAT